MENDRKTLELKKPLIFFVVLIILLFLGFNLFQSFSNSRKAEVYNKYASETEKYISENRAVLTELFNNKFPNQDCDSYSTNGCTKPYQDEIAKLVPPTLKDWSSTAFIKKNGSVVLTMNLGGDVREFYYYPENEGYDLVKLLNGELDKVEWEDYSYELPGKEVVIPVKDENGKVLVAIMRGVIEPKSF